MRRLTGWDAMMLYSETFTVPTHTLKIAIINATESDGEFTFERLRHVVAKRLPVLDPLRFQLVNIPYRLHHPMWIERDEVNLDYHLHRVAVPSPGGRRELDDVIAEIARIPLNRSRPLWELYLAEGLAGGRAAVIVKVHHALADGAASANIVARAVDPTVTAPGAGVIADEVAPPAAQLVRQAGRDHLRQLRDLPGLIRDTRAGGKRVRQLSEQRSEDPDIAQPLSSPHTFINHRVSAGRRFATATICLDQAKETKDRLGVTLNDLVLSIAAGALRELRLRHEGASAKPMIASVPVSTDPSPDRLSGNAIGGLLVSLPTHVSDPVERARLTSIATAHAKEDNALRGPELMGRWMNYLPPLLVPPAFGLLSKRAGHNRLYNLSISNVPGPRRIGYVAGAPISELYSVGPLTPGSGMNITVWSYVDQLNVAVLTDDLTVKDAHEVTDAMVAEFSRIRSAVGLSAEAAVVDRAMAHANALG